MNKILTFFGMAAMAFSQCGCSFTENRSFGYDVKLMARHHQPIVLQAGKAKVAVLGEYQGRVMTSTSEGDNGFSYGWFKHEALKNGKVTENNAILGGEDRLWYGPETGRFSVIFKPGTARTVENISMPDAMSILPFDVSKLSKSAVTFTKNIHLQNHSGFIFEAAIARTISIFDNKNIEQNLGVDLDEKMSAVGFRAESSMTNIGKENWRKETGLLSLWDISGLKHSEHNTVVMPLRGTLKEVTAYFTPTLDSHTKIIDGVAYYNADANYMNKIGIPPQNTKPILGSFDAVRNILTIVQFKFDDTPDALYVNSVWTDEPAPYGGDVINIFNDGAAGGKPFGPFYELESSSNALELNVGENQEHYQNTYHFSGDVKALNALALQLLGVSLADINAVFK